jgi:hypothetical protein
LAANFPAARPVVAAAPVAPPRARAVEPVQPASPAWLDLGAVQSQVGQQVAVYLLEDPQAETAQDKPPSEGQTTRPRSPSGSYGGVYDQRLKDQSHLEAVDNRYNPVPGYERYERARAFNPFNVSQTGEFPIVAHGNNVLNPYKTNKFKGDLPIYGENVFLRIDALSNNVFEQRDIAGTAEDDHVAVFQQFLSFDVFHGDTVFRPATWRAKVTLANDMRLADIAFNNEAHDFALQEIFFEALIAEFDPSFDSVSARIGRQAFASDFRNFLFVDVNDGFRLFGNAAANRIQYDVAFFDLTKKDRFSNLNRSDANRKQQVFVTDFFFQDAVYDGYTAEGLVMFVNDNFKESIDVFYLGFFGDGRIGIFEVSHALVGMLGDHDDNGIAGRDVNSTGYLFALEVALPRDWYKFVGSFLFASGDTDANDSHGDGFDGVFDNPDFAGANFGFWHRQAVNVGGVPLVNTNSLYPNLRTKAFQGPNSVNPGMLLLHGGFEATLSNFWAVFLNASMMRFVHTDSVEAATGRVNGIARQLGVDLSIATQYRPLGIDNIILTGGVAAFVPGEGFTDFTRAAGGATQNLLIGSFITAAFLF